MHLPIIRAGLLGLRELPMLGSAGCILMPWQDWRSARADQADGAGVAPQLRYATGSEEACTREPFRSHHRLGGGSARVSAQIRRSPRIRSRGHLCRYAGGAAGSSVFAGGGKTQGPIDADI